MRKKVLSVALAAALALSTIPMLASANTADVEDLIVMGQDFNDKTTEDSADSIMNNIFGPYTNPAFVERAEGDMWLSIDGKAGQQGQSIKMESSLGEESANSATAIAFYMKTTDATPPYTDSTTQIQIFAQKENPNSIGYPAGFFGQKSGNVDVTYITADGVVSTSSTPFVSAPANFDGWVLFPLSNLEHRHSDPGGEDQGKLAGNQIWGVGFDIQSSTEGSKYYFDDICLVEDQTAFVNALKAPVTDTKPEGLDNFYLGQGFGIYDVGTKSDANGNNITALIAGFNADQATWEITDNTLGYGNAATMTPVGEEGGKNSVGFMDISTNYSAADRAAMAGSEGLAIRVKTPKTHNSADMEFLLMVMEGKADDLANGGEMYKYRDTWATDPCQLTLVDAKTNQFVTKDVTSAHCIPQDFDGWIIIPNNFFEFHPGYAAQKDNGTLDWNLMTRMTFLFSNALVGEPMVFDNIGVVKSIDGFLEDLGAEPQPVDKDYVFSVDEIAKIPKADFEYAQENKVSVDITVEDGYALYRWIFAGDTITNPIEFDPAITFDFDEIETIEGLVKGEMTARFFKTAAGTLPGEAALYVHTDDVVENPYLYRYDPEKKTITLVSNDQQVVDPDLSMAILSLNEGGIYFMSDEKIELKEGTISTDPGADEKDPEANEKEPADTGVSSMGFVVIALLLASGLVVVYFSKKRRVYNK